MKVSLIVRVESGTFEITLVVEPDMSWGSALEGETPPTMDTAQAPDISLPIIYHMH